MQSYTIIMAKAPYAPGKVHLPGDWHSIRVCIVFQ
jgi:hypothetical protein